MMFSVFGGVNIFCCEEILVLEDHYEGETQMVTAYDTGRP